MDNEIEHIPPATWLWWHRRQSRLINQPDIDAEHTIDQTRDQVALHRPHA